MKNGTREFIEFLNLFVKKYGLVNLVLFTLEKGILREKCANILSLLYNIWSHRKNFCKVL